MASAKPARIAVLIDADNTQPAIAQALLAEIAKYGVASVKRVYGDWTQPNLRGWKEQLVESAIQPQQQFAYTSGKNSTDSAMIIDAMDLLYTDRFDAFCIVTSDSDFTRLASRLRESGKDVYGFGERKTPQSLVSACDKFTYLDVLRGTAAKTAPAEAAAKPAKARTKAAKKPDKQTPPAPAAEPERKPASPADPELQRLLREAVDDDADNDGWAMLPSVGNLIAKRKPDFDSRNYGYKKLRELVQATGLFEIDERSSADGKQKVIYLRDNRKKG
jgi:uncharacterized protein (TIGR00288 family)